MEAEQPESMHISMLGLSTFRRHFSGCSDGGAVTALTSVVGCREDFTFTILPDLLEVAVLLLLLAVESVGDGDLLLLLDALFDRLRLRC